MNSLLKDALSDEKGNQSSARWGALGFFVLVVLVLFVWLLAAIFGAKAVASDAIKILSTLATTCAAILGTGQVKSAVVGAVSPPTETTATQPTDKAKMTLNTAKAAMLMAKVQATATTSTTTAMAPKCPPPEAPKMGGDP